MSGPKNRRHAGTPAVHQPAVLVVWHEAPGELAVPSEFCCQYWGYAVHADYNEVKNVGFNLFRAGQMSSSVGPEDALCFSYRP